MDCFGGGNDEGFCGLIGVLNEGLLNSFNDGGGSGINCFIGVLIEDLLDCFGDGNDGGFCGLIGVLDGGLLVVISVV